MKASTEKSLYLGLLASSLIAVIVYIVMIGTPSLDSQNIGWLHYGDPSQHYLGWQFFANSPWSFPIGLNPTYGLEISSSITYTDSIPILAFIFKPLSGLLPSGFHYFGWWLLFCFAMQANFGYLILRRFTGNTLTSILGSTLFLISPPMIVKIHGHLALVGHFLVLAAIYTLFFHSREAKYSWWRWSMVLCTAALTHAYLLAMVLALWGIGLLRSAQNGLPFNERCRVFAKNGFPVAAALFLTLWQAGYFSVGEGVGAGGFGHFKMNLFSIIDPTGWSYFMHDFPNSSGEYEGFNYLGIGNILVLILAVVLAIVQKGTFKRTFQNNRDIFFACLFLTIFALTHKLGIGSYQTEVIYPKFLRDYGGIFRSSGRMFWPVFYLIILWAISTLVRGFGNKWQTQAIIVVASCWQFYDTTPGWSQLTSKMAKPPVYSWPSKMNDPFWLKTKAKYTKTRWIPTSNYPPHWKEINTYSLKNGMATDAVALARTDKNKLAARHRASSSTIKSASFEKDTLYFFDEGTFKYLAQSVMQEEHLLAKIDGYYILAPFWEDAPN